jgi:chemotaxis family two-component system response regulator Rcp1
MPMNQAKHILVVEDNPGDVRLIQEAFKETCTAIEIANAKDGVEALDYLYARGAFAGARRPDLILLDLNLPKKGGREVLAEIKADTTLKQIPVVVFSSSSAPADVTGAYRLQANCYVTKPADLDDLFEAISWIARVWLNMASLPDRVGKDKMAVQSERASLASLLS